MVDGISSSTGVSGQKHESMAQRLASLGIPSDVIQQGRDAVKAYAEKNSISLPEPPARNNGNSVFKGAHNKEDIAAKLAAYGIPADIAQQGPQAVQAYAQKNGISLPTPPSQPAPPNAGQSLDIKG